MDSKRKAMAETAARLVKVYGMTESEAIRLVNKYHADIRVANSVVDNGHIVLRKWIRDSGEHSARHVGGGRSDNLPRVAGYIANTARGWTEAKAVAAVNKYSHLVDANMYLSAERVIQAVENEGHPDHWRLTRHVGGGGKPKRPTYDQAKTAIMQELARRGWKMSGPLKVSHATSPDGGYRLWFKAQSIYYTEGNSHSLNGAHSLTGGFVDIRDESPEQFVNWVERTRS